MNKTANSTLDLAVLEAARLGYWPEQQPVLELPLLPALDPVYLQADFLQSALSLPLSWSVEPLFEHEFVADFEQCPTLRKAAVCMPLVQRENGLHLLLTRRAGHLVHHAGQISFPGGSVEKDDISVVHTALRETHEEIGIQPGLIQALSEEPIFMTNSRFAMRPIVGLVQPGFDLCIDPSEVAEVFEVPLAWLMDPAQHRLHCLHRPQQAPRYYFSMRWQNYFIWGATAVIIRNFYHHLAALIHYSKKRVNT